MISFLKIILGLALCLCLADEMGKAEESEDR